MMFSLVLAAALTAETSRPNCSYYEFGAPVEATFKADGLKPGERRRMSVEVVDEHERKLKSFDEEIVAGADGKWSKTLSMPAERMGFYRVRAKSGELTLPKRGSRPAGCITYAVMPDPAKRVAPPEEDAFMGNMGENGGDAKVSRWIGSRFTFGADTPSAAPDGAAKRKAAREKELAETGYVRYGGATVAYHDLSKLRPFFTEEGRKWMEAQPFRKSSHLTWKMLETDEGERHYRDAVAAFTRAARAQLPPGRKRLLMEFFSEPDLTAPSPEMIVKAAKAVWEAVQSVDKDALVAQPGLSTITAQGFHQRLFDLGIGQYMNAFHVHPYTPYPPEPNNYLQNVRNVKRMVREGTGRDDIPLFALEAGFPIAATKDGELLQMNGEVRCLLMLLGEGFKYNYVFYSSDYGNDAGDNAEGDYGITYNLKLKTKRFGTDCVSPRPVMPALAAFSWLLDGYRPVSCIDYLGDTVLGYAYRNRKGVCALALWDFGGTRTIEIPVGRAKVRVADVFANESERETDDGTLKLEVGPSPVYVMDVDPSAWGGGAQIVKPDGGGRSVVAGGRLDVKGTATEDGSIEVRLAAATGVAPVAVKVVGGSFATSFTLPETTPDGDYPVMLAFRGADGRLRSVTGYRVTVNAPVRIGRPEPSFAGGEPGVRFTAENLTDEPREVVFETRVRGVPESRCRIEQTLPARASRTVEACFAGWTPNPFSLFGVEVAATSGQMRSERRKELNFLCAKHVPGAGRNGDFSAWKPDFRAAPEKIIANERLYSGPDDISVKVACGWNDEYLLFAFDVQDDAFVQNRTGWITWWGDSIQLALAKDVLEKTTANAATDLLLQAMTETTFALTPKGPEVYRTKTFNDKLFPSGTHGEGQVPLSECPFAVKTEPNDKGVLISYRMAVPWSFLRIDRPVAGQSVYFAASANDVDADAKSCMMYGVFELKQAAPKRFGRIVLASPQR